MIQIPDEALTADTLALLEQINQALETYCLQLKDDGQIHEGCTVLIIEQQRPLNCPIA